MFRDERLEPTWVAGKEEGDARIIDICTREILARDALDPLYRVDGFDPGFRGEPLVGGSPSTP